MRLLAICDLSAATAGEPATDPDRGGGAELPSRRPRPLAFRPQLLQVQIAFHDAQRRVADDASVTQVDDRDPLGIDHRAPDLLVLYLLLVRRGRALRRMVVLQVLRGVLVARAKLI